MKIGALFAGYGGLDIATERVFGARTAWVSEFDAAPSRILAARFPDAPNLGDVTKVDWSAVEPVDIITGGSPCQDLSHAGKRAGMKTGTRSGLWASMCDAIETIRPRFVVWENVRGALSAGADSAVEPCPICVGDGSGVTLRALGRVLGDLAELGYDAAWCGLRASDVGAPHGRFRVFVLAWPADAESDTGRQRDRDRGAAADPDGAAGGAEGGRARPDAGRRGRASADDVTLLPTPAVNDMGDGKTLEWWDDWAPRQKSAKGTPAPHGKSLAIEALRLMPTPRATDGTKGGPNQRGSSGDLMLPSAVRLLPTPTAVTRDRTEEQISERRATRTKGLNLDEVRGSEFGQYAPAIARWAPVVGRPAPAPTEATGKGGAHRLSPRFVEWMMGLPDGWVTDVGLSRNEQLKALGNGVVPQQAEAALGHMLDVRSGEIR